MLKSINTVIYLESKNELYLFGFDKATYTWMISSGILNQKKRIHIFLTHLSLDWSHDLALLIKELYQERMNQDCSRINVYYPNQAILEYLKLQQISPKWYNLFVNLWDEVPMDDYNKSLEYMFYEEQPFAGDSLEEAGLYSIELQIPEMLSAYICAGNLQKMYERGVSYEQVYVTEDLQQVIKRE